MRRVCISGSAFDPLHFGHIGVCVAVLHTLFVDEVWMTPSPDRWDKRPCAPAHRRKTWVELAVAELNRVGYAARLCVAELEATTYRGTYRFLWELREAYPDIEFSFVVGTDAYQKIGEWRDPVLEERNGRRLLAEFPFFVVQRGCELPPQPLFPDSLAPTFLPALDRIEPLLPRQWNVAGLAQLSSSEIRRHFLAGEQPAFCWTLPSIEEDILADNPFVSIRENGTPVVSGSD